MSGELTTCYVLRFPFELEGKFEIAGLEEAFTRTFKSLTVRLTGDGHFYVLTITGFESADAAKGFITSVWAGLTWALLNRGIPFRAELEPRTVVVPDDPVKAAKNIFKSGRVQRVDSLGDGNAPCVYPSDENMGLFLTSSFHVRLSDPVEKFYEYFAQGLGATNAEAVISDVRLRTALELYGAHLTENSAHAKLLTLAMALECLTIKSDKHAVALELIGTWQAQIKDALKAHPEESEERFSLKCLEREVLFRRESSIRSRVRHLVLQTFRETAPEQARELARTAVRIYGMRGTLIHEGTLPEKQLAQATSDARMIVARLLRAKFKIAWSTNGT